MAQQKGHTGNPNGRPKGTPNKITSAIRNWIVELINDNREQLQQDIQQIEPKDRLAFIEKLLPYVLPKVERADEVEGAAYTKADVETKSIVSDWPTDKKVLPRWYETD
jgi:hypothetical protein